MEIFRNSSERTRTIYINVRTALKNHMNQKKIAHDTITTEKFKYLNIYNFKPNRKS